MDAVDALWMLLPLTATFDELTIRIPTVLAAFGFMCLLETVTPEELSTSIPIPEDVFVLIQPPAISKPP